MLYNKRSILNPFNKCFFLDIYATDVVFVEGVGCTLVCDNSLCEG